MYPPLKEKNIGIKNLYLWAEILEIKKSELIT
jgi:hypothetical protein